MNEAKQEPTSVLALPERMKPLAQRQLPAGEVSPFSLVQMAVQRGDPLEVINKLVDVAERLQANIARSAFNQAFAAFKTETVRIIKNTDVKDGPLKGKKYADLFDIVVAVVEPLAKHGLTHSWKLTKDEKDWMEITCILKHADGHFETDTQGGAPDTGPGRNAIQARRSTRTYLEKSTLTGVTGLAAANSDDDGSGGKKEVEPLTDEHLATIKAIADEIPDLNVPAFLKHMTDKTKVECKTMAGIPDNAYPDAVAALQQRRKVATAKKAAKP